MGRHCVWVSLSGWVCPVLIFLELGVSPPQLLAGLPSCLPILNITFAGDSVAGEHPPRQWGCVISSPKTQPLWAQGGGGGEACGLSSIPHWGVADTGHTMAQHVPAALCHLRTLRKKTPLLSLAWWLTPAMPALGRKRLENQAFGPAWAT